MQKFQFLLFTLNAVWKVVFTMVVIVFYSIDQPILFLLTIYFHIYFIREIFGCTYVTLSSFLRVHCLRAMLG